MDDSAAQSLQMLRLRLQSLQDAGYREFQCRLMPTVPPETVIGVRTPDVRRLAREVRGTHCAADFLRALPHAYYEENNLHAFLIEPIADWREAAAALDAFLPYVDNWATCDSLSPRAFRSHPAGLRDKIFDWLRAAHPYTVRFAIGALLRFYLDDAFDPDDLRRVAAVRSQEYYVNMMAAWYFATALAKQPAAALPCFEQRKLARWTHNKAIQKALESRRISPLQKAALRALKWP